MKPTEQQVSVIDAVKKGRSIKVSAFAGSGKTTTLRLVAENISPDRRALYVVFNRAAAEEARGRFPSHITVRTAHSLAYGAVGHAYKDRLVNNLLATVETAKAVCRDELDAIHLAQGRDRDDWKAHQLVTEVLHNFLCSDSEEISVEHVPAVVRHLKKHALEEPLVAAAKAYWEQMIDPKGRMPITHDVYLKLWQLRHPSLGYDLIMFDEAQDANPVMLSIFAEQARAQRVLVGDTHQQLYSWRGAVDAMQKVDLPDLPLTHSWRFGPAIAGQANRILSLKKEKRTLVGRGAERDAVVDAGEIQASAVLGRTNGGLVSEAVRQLDDGRQVAVVGGVTELVWLLNAAWDLWYKGSTAHPELCMFSDWMELEEIAETPVGSAYRPLVTLVRRYKGGMPKIAGRLRREVTEDERAADVVLSTVHRAKGREWESVRLLSDFPNVLDETGETPMLLPEEVNVQYVAQTRARSLLDAGGNGRMIDAAVSKLVAKGVESDGIENVATVR